MSAAGAARCDGHGERSASEADAKKDRESVGQTPANPAHAAVLASDQDSQSGRWGALGLGGAESGRWGANAVTDATAGIGPAGAARSRAQRGPDGSAGLTCLDSHSSGLSDREPLSVDLKIEEMDWRDAERLRSAVSAARRRAFKLGHDMVGFFRAVGLNRVMMLELTHGQDGPRRLAKKWDRLAKSGSIPWLRDWGRITEPHKSGAAHFHFVIEAPEGLDVRTGFDFEALRRADEAAQARNWPECARWTKIYAASAHPWLRLQWRRLRMLTRRYGFGGHCRLVPVRTGGEAVAKYVSKYLGKCLGHDLGKEWHGARRVEWSRKAAYKLRRKVSSQFAWAGIVSGNGPKYRGRIGQIARALGLADDDLDGLRRVIGPRWAYHWGPFLRGSDEIFAGFLLEVPLRNFLRRSQRKIAHDAKPRLPGYTA